MQRDDARRLRRVALGAAAAAIVTRIPFTASRLWDHDSVQFALGVERYDLAAHHPHPPGYPLYIAVLKLLALLGVDSLHGMEALSIAAAALGAGLIVPLVARLMALSAARVVEGRRTAAMRMPSPAVPAHLAGARDLANPGDRSDPHDLADPACRGDRGDSGDLANPGKLAAGALAAALFVFDPLLWFYGELPLVYAVEAGMAVGLAYAALRMADGRGPFLAACAAFALAGGIRPSTLVLLLPLFLVGAWNAWRRGATPGTLAAGAVVAVVLGLAWLVPLLAAAGGYAAYRRIGSEHFNALLPYTSILYGAGWRALAHNLTIMTKWFLQGLVPAAAALVVAWVPWPSGRQRRQASEPHLPDEPSALTVETRPPEEPSRLVVETRSAAPAADDRWREPSAVLTGERRLAAARAGWCRLAAASPWLAAWALPPILFFALFHVTKAGYTLVYLPALLVGTTLLAAPALGKRSGRAAAAILVAAAAGAGLFLFGADRRPDQPRAWAVVRDEFNRTAIATYDRDLDSLLAVLRRLPPGATVLATVELSGTGAAGADGFLYPWQRHLQWYLPDYEVLHLVPEDRIAFATRGHRPFHREGSRLDLPPGTQQIAVVLSGPTGARFPLARWPLRRIGETFCLVVIPFPGRLVVGPYDFETAATGTAAPGRAAAGAAVTATPGRPDAGSARAASTAAPERPASGASGDASHSKTSASGTSSPASSGVSRTSPAATDSAARSASLPAPSTAR